MKSLQNLKRIIQSLITPIMSKKQLTLPERYTKFMTELKVLSDKYGIDLVPSVSIKDLLAPQQPTPTEVPTPKEAPKRKGGK